MIKPKHFLTKAVSMALIATTVLPTASFADQQVQTKEINEQKVLDQSKEISKKSIGTSDTVILVKAGNDKDILKATVIAAEKKNTVLIADDINKDTIAALKDLGAKNVLVSGGFDKEALKDFKAEDFKETLNRGSKECVVISTKDKSTALSLSALAVKSGMDVYFEDDNLNEIHDKHYDKIYVTSDELASTIKGNAENLKGKSNFETELNIAKKANAKNLILLTNIDHNLNAALLSKTEDAALVVVNDEKEIKKATKELNPNTIIMLGDARTKSADSAQLVNAPQNAPAQIARRAVGPQRSYSYKVIQTERARKQPVYTNESKVTKAPSIDLEAIEKEIRDAFADETVNSGNKEQASDVTTKPNNNKYIAPVAPVTVEDTDANKEKKAAVDFKDNAQVTSEKLEALRAELQTEKNKKAALIGEISRLEARINTLSSKSSETGKKEIVEEAVEETEPTTEVVAVDNSGKITELRASIDGKRGEIEGLRARLNTIPEYVEIDNPEYKKQLKELNNTSTNRSNNTSGTNSNTTTNSNSTTNKYPTVDKKISVKNEERKSLEAQISSLEGMITGLKGQISSLENETSRVVTKPATVKPRRSRRSVTVNEDVKPKNTAEISVLKEEVAAKKVEIEEINKKISYIQEDINKELANIEEANNRRQAEERAKAEAAAKKSVEEAKTKLENQDQARANSATALINAYIVNKGSYDDAYTAITRIQNQNTKDYLLGQLSKKRAEIQAAENKKAEKETAKNVEAQATEAFNNYKKSATVKSYDQAMGLINQIKDSAKRNSLIKKLDLQKAAIEKIKANEAKKNNNQPVSNAQVLSRLGKDLEEFRSKGYNGLSKSNSFYLSNVSGLTAAQLEKGLKYNLKGLGAAFVKAEKDTGVNAILLAAMANHESDYGRSNIAKSKGNLFGWNAVDADPYNQASTYSKFEDSIREVSKKLKSYYLSPNGKYFNGYTTDGINKSYSSDKEWPSKVNQHMVTIAKLILGN